MTTSRIRVTATMSIAAAAMVLTCAACSRSSTPGYRTFATPEDAVRALVDAAKAGPVENVVAIFGPDGKALVDSSDAATARRNRQVFTVAAAERWQLADQPDGSKVLVVGNEAWPFPVPLVKDANGWRFDTPAGKEEILARRIGRNELAVIWICRAYVAAQRLYAEHPHDGLPAGVYAQSVRSSPGRQNGLFWPAAAGQKRSPLGDLVALAAEEGTPLDTPSAQPAPFHGYYYKILTAQGGNAPGGAKDYVTQGRMTGGFALVAWPAEYDATGVMTFVVNQDGIVREKDLGAGTAAAARSMTLYNPDASWTAVQ
ncbi:MAG TPA: DUF2950 domain-containing protein [Vicinamibacterales bacterium]|nr:DUF2950 domain-containing protein [Vicinamibacterales bacterium]